MEERDDLLSMRSQQSPSHAVWERLEVRGRHRRQRHMCPAKNLSATAREITAAKVAPCWYEPQRYRDAPMAERGSPIATVNVQHDDATHNRFEASHLYPPMVERRFANYPSTMGTASS
jgi:hypothetical protein